MHKYVQLSMLACVRACVFVDMNFVMYIQNFEINNFKNVFNFAYVKVE